MFVIRISFLLVLIFMTTTCQRLQNAAYNLAEAPYAERFLSSLLEKENIVIEDLHCEMMNTTRNFGCTFTAPQQSPGPNLEAQWVQALQLAAGTPESTRQRYLHTLYPKNCEKKAPFDQNLDAPRFLLFENKEPQFPAVKGLDYLVLYVDTQTRQACVQAAHSLGYR